jgi:UDP-N-acetylmuramate dehydrogenase
MLKTDVAQSGPIFVPSFIQQQVPLADKNWFKTGGPARYFAQPTNAQEMADALAFARDNQLPLFMLGSGANILISDAGFDGLVINPKIMNVSHTLSCDTAYLTAGAGVALDQLINYSLEHNLLGLEEFSGIPGTVGGAVFINLHYFEFLFSHFITQATVINTKTGVISVVDTSWFNFGYNQSRLHDREHMLIDATFKVRLASRDETMYAKGRSTEIIRHRAQRYPKANTCGSFFRNFYPEEVTLVSEGKKVIWVAYYLDKVGVKGTLKVGNAQVSHQHANMLTHKGGATTQDLIAVAREMQWRVHEQFGIMPQPECQLVGFAEYPLYQ